MRLASGRWEIHVRPERGGRITSVRLDGEELLDQGIGVDQPTANGFVEGGAWGWDEMVPNLDATDSLPDHGEAWRLPWTVVARSPNSLGLSCDGRLVPWRLGRRVFVDDSVEVFYQYTNLGSEPHRAYWCAHPLFRYEPEMEISIDVPRPAEEKSAKTFLPSGSVEQVQLRWRSGKGIEMSWDSFLTPELAIWVCNGDLGGYRQIAVEPATASPLLESGATMTWWLRITPL
jgi:galactose mutarotase-like enzyme